MFMTCLGCQYASRSCLFKTKSMVRQKPADTHTVRNSLLIDARSVKYLY